MNTTRKNTDKVKPKVLHTKTYTVTFEHLEDGSTSMTRTNDGFHAFELLGIADLISTEVRAQVMGTIKPDKITRQVVVPDGNN